MSISLSDLVVVRNDLLRRGVKVDDIRRKTPIDAWDGNGFVLRELDYR